MSRMRSRGLHIMSSISRRRLHIISKSETKIRPASSTPVSLKYYNLPLHDQMMPHFFIPMIFFYPNTNHTPQPTTAISNLLKNSLSQTLSRYYPFAGKRCGSYIDCNDEGVNFLEAKIGCKLSDLVEKGSINDEEDGVNHLFPPRSIWNSISDNNSSLVVQLNHFTCGGIAIAASLSHGLSDALTFCTFLKYWATLSRGDDKKLSHIHPVFICEPQRIQSHDRSIINGSSFPDKYWITKEIVFHNTSIAKLKEAVENQDKLEGLEYGAEIRYTRNELVTALLYKCVVSAADNVPSVLFQIVNLRPMMDPLQPETVVGNLAAPNHVPTSIGKSEVKLNELVRKMRQGRNKLKGIQIKDLVDYAALPILYEYTKSKHRIFVVSSMCNFPLYDEMDFGWGRPINATLVDQLRADSISLMDTPNKDGIKAVVSLEQKEMESFLAHKDLISYAQERVKIF